MASAFDLINQLEEEEKKRKTQGIVPETYKQKSAFELVDELAPIRELEKPKPKEEIKPAEQPKKEDRSFLSRAQEAIEYGVVGAKQLPSTIKAFLGLTPKITEDVIKQAAPKETANYSLSALDNSITLYEERIKGIENQLKTGTKKSDLPKAVSWMFGEGDNVPLSEQDRYENEKTLKDYQDRLAVLKAEKAKEEQKPSLAKKLREEGARERTEIATKGREELIKKYGQPESLSLQWIANEVAINTPQYLATVPVGLAVSAITKNPQVGMAIGFAPAFVLESAGGYQEAIAEGLSDEQAQEMGINRGIFNGLLEIAPIGKLLSKTPAGQQIKNNVMKRAGKYLIERVKDGVYEGGTESMQEIIGNALMMEYKEDKGLFDNALEAGVVGGVMGSIGGGTFDLMAKIGGQPETTQDTQQIDNPSILDAETIDIANKAIVDAMATNPESRTPLQQELIQSLQVEPQEAQIEKLPTEQLKLDDITETKIQELNIKDAKDPITEEKETKGYKRFYQSTTPDVKTDWYFDSPEALAKFMNNRTSQDEVFKYEDILVENMVKDKERKEVWRMQPTEQIKSTITPKVDEALMQEARKYKSAEEFVKAQGDSIKTDYSNRFREAESRLPDVPKIIQKDLTEKSADVYKKIHAKEGVEVVANNRGRFDIVSGTRKKTFIGMTPQERESFYKANQDLFQNKTLIYEAGENGGIYSNSPSINTSQLTDIYNQARQTDPLESLKAEAKKYKSAEEFVNNRRWLYHQTTPEAMKKIEKEGFRTDIIGAGRSDILPSGVNTKSTDVSLKLKGDQQLEVSPDKNLNIREFDKRSDVEDYLASTSKEYRDIVEKINRIDKESSLKADKIENDDEAIKYLDSEYQKILDLSKSARKIASNIFEKQGIDGIKINTDAGSFGRITDNLIVFNPKKVYTKSQLTDIYNQAIKEAPSQEKEQKVKPEVKPEGKPKEETKKPSKLGESRFQERIKEQLLDTDPARYELDEKSGKYNKLNLEKDAKKAVSYLEQNPEEAVAVSLGLKEAPEGQTANAIGIVTALKAKDEKNYKLYADIINSVSLRSTKLGQEIVSLRGHFNNESPENYARRIIDAKMNRLAPTLVSMVEKAGRKWTNKEVITREIDKKTKALKEKIKKEQKKISLAQDIIDSLRC